jgi:chromate transport protein ChrA
MGSSFRAAKAAVVEGWRRVAGFPLGLLALWVATAGATLPAAAMLAASIEDHLGDSMTASAVASGVDLRWWDEFSSAARPGQSFSPTIIGGAGPVGTYAGLLDGDEPPVEIIGAVMLVQLLWLFLSGGLLDRYARRRRGGARGFFGACGVFFFRFLRLGLLAGVAYAVIVGPYHGWIFETAYPWLTRETSVERTAFVWRALLYTLWLIPLLLVNVIVDYAKVRAVIEDRHSMIGALVGAVRFIRRHPAPVAVVYGLNAAVAAVVLAAYIVLAPDGRGGDWRLLAVLAIGGLYLLARQAIRLAFLAGAMTLLERSFAHAEYTAPPLPIWPDSPAAEAIDNAALVATLRSSE